MNASKLFATSKERHLIPWLLLIDPWLIKTGKKKVGVIPGVHGEDKHLMSSAVSAISSLNCLSTLADT